MHIGIIPDGNRRWVKENIKNSEDLLNQWKSMLTSRLKGRVINFTTVEEEGKKHPDKWKYSKDITEDPHKMEELEFYLKFIKDKDSKKVSKILEKVMIYDLSNRGAAMMEEAEKLNDSKLTSSVPQKDKTTDKPKEKKDE